MTVSTIKTESTLPPSLNPGIRLPDILQTLPKDCFQQDWRKAWLSLVVSVICVGLGYWGLVVAPWFLLPVLWIFTGTALTGFFVIAHDCGHRSFSKHLWVNDWVGHILLLPLIYPFHAWRILHNQHHTHTNKLGMDNAWEPFQPEYYQNSPRWLRWGYQAMRGRFWWLASIAHWAVLHFNWTRFEGKERERVKFSALLVIGFAAITLLTLLVTTGVWGVVKFWLVPWLVYHFWMSTFTLVHHTAPHIQFHPAEQWNAAMAQLSGSVHCDYPRWVEVLCHDINVHIPHHLSTAIPSYNLRLAHQSLLDNWEPYLNTCQFSWKLMAEITDQCHLYDSQRCYQSFQEFHNSH
jgi:omega-6 fatty acid desaturase (delta-12 desaturase)